MYLFISFVVALISLYYIGVMVDTYNADTTYLTPLIILLIYSILSIIRQIRENPLSWLIDDDYYYDSSSYNNGYNTKTIEIVHYPTNNEVRERMKELEKSYWFKIKKNIASIFAIDITKKYYEKYKKPYKINNKCKVANINSSNSNNNYSPYAPPSNWWDKKEMEEYNQVAKHMKKRSCEISIDENLNENVAD